MAATYHNDCNKGVNNTQHFYTKVIDQTGKVINEPEQKQEKRVAYVRRKNAYILTSMMEDVVVMVQLNRSNVQEI